MSYQVIARKYRPQRFADVVGQEHVTRTLSHAIDQKRIAHAYLFCGPRGTGKTTVARIFAKSLNCTDGPKVEFDENDPRCKEITEGRSLDVLEIDGASNNGVEQVRELRETCKYAPASSRFKIYIIDEVHMLSTAAFNALLKTLEEPPEHVKFMFATTDPEKVLPTILSRCQRFDLRRIPTALISQHLGLIAKQEKVEIDPVALYAIARGAEGGMRDAESTLDQLISFCGNKIEEADVLSMFGLTAQGQLLDLSNAVLTGAVEKALRQLGDLAAKGKDLGRLITDLLNHFRNLLIFRVSNGDLTMLEVSEAEGTAIGEQATLASVEGLTRILELLGETEMRLRDAASRKILIEVALLKCMEARNALPIDTVLKQLRDLRSGDGAAGKDSPAGRPVPSTPIAQTPTPATTATPAPSPKPARPVAQSGPAPAAQSISADALRETPAPTRIAPAPQAAASTTVAASPADLANIWGALIEEVGKVSQFARSYLLEAHPVSLNRNLLTIGFDPQFEEHMALVDNPRNHELLQTKLTELGWPRTQVKFIKAENPEARVKPVETASPAEPQPAKPAAPRKAAPAPTAEKETKAAMVFDKEDFKNDPLIAKALELFKGQIVNVRA